MENPFKKRSLKETKTLKTKEENNTIEIGGKKHPEIIKKLLKDYKGCFEQDAFDYGFEYNHSKCDVILKYFIKFDLESFEFILSEVYRLFKEENVSGLEISNKFGFLGKEISFTIKESKLKLFSRLYIRIIQFEDNFELRFNKYDSDFFNSEDLLLLKSILEYFKEKIGVEDEFQRSVRIIESIGANFITKEKVSEYNFESIAGYQEEKNYITHSVIDLLQNKELINKLSQDLLIKPSDVSPKAILFEGAPGVGKTTFAKIIANQIDAPLIYVPTESIVSKWYGESEQKLQIILSEAEKIENSIIFIDEIDSLAGSREKDINEATRRILSVLLRAIDGLKTSKNGLIIGATNQPDHLDNALLNRFDIRIEFHLPNLEERKAIFKLYAKHLDDKELNILAEKSENFSGRTIEKISKNVIRSWASEMKRNSKEYSLPNIEIYLKEVSIFK